MIWFWVPDSGAPMVDRKFVLLFTSATQPDNLGQLKYIATVQVGAYTYHVFEVLNSVGSTNLCE